MCPLKRVIGVYVINVLLATLIFWKPMDKLKTALANSRYTETLGDFPRAKRSPKPFFDCGG
jgi:hypothetical protein